MEPSLALPQFQLRVCTFIFVRSWLHMAVADCKAGVGDGVGCVGDSFAHHSHLHNLEKVEGGPLCAAGSPDAPPT